MELSLLLYLYSIFLFSKINANNSGVSNSEPLYDNQSKGQTPFVGGFLSSDSILFISTFDGTLNAVNQKTGGVLWSLKEEPVLKMPTNDERRMIFFASPIDGSLYTFKVGMDGLKKLPITIPDLVSISPTKSTDGLLYTGYKKDTWFSVDLITGSKIHILNSDGAQEFCPSNTPSTIFIGRTEYSVMMFDGVSRQINWNATFMDYATHVSFESSSFGLKHFASSSDGFLVTMDAETGHVSWSQQFDSPVVGIYSINNDRALVSCPFNSMDIKTLAHLSEKGLVGSDWADKFSLADRFKDTFLPTLYLGRHGSLSYALPSFVDASTVSICPKNFGRPLLEGPRIENEKIGPPNLPHKPSHRENNQQKVKTREVFLIGHHEMPDTLTQINMDRLPMKLLEYKTQPIPADSVPHLDSHLQLPGSSNFSSQSASIDVLRHSSDWTKTSFYALVPTALTVLLGFLFYWKKHEAKTSLNGQEGLTGDGTFIKGKISYDETGILGRGCHGTIVFRGKFEGRDVAVKRVLTGYVDVANREVDLLKMSDHHRNVVRYFCMEADHQFNYIALELCPATLHDVIEKIAPNEPQAIEIDSRDIIHQMLSGIAHLHSLNIVHRDVKPHNVLLSEPDRNSKVRVMISDFGLCRKLSPNRLSLSNVSGWAGTDGWVAPEVLNSNCEKTTRAVDVFSSGLVLFYVLTMGSHPFGDPLVRQNNIVSGKFNMVPLYKWEDHATAGDIIMKMIDRDPLKRPPIESVLVHPMLWSKEKHLKFFEAISDRLEKLPETDKLVVLLNKKPNNVVKTSWAKAIHKEFFTDQRKFRSYQVDSIRDLIRFIRNKHHHYHELPRELQDITGPVPDGLVTYFTKKFPSLLIHNHRTMECLKEEHLFKPFY